MIFKETWQQVLDGTKTQARRPVKEGDEGIGHRWKDGRWLEIDLVRSKTGRLKWMVGDGYIPRTYAIEPGRGKKAIGRIRITKIRRERLQEISSNDCRAEGITDNDISAAWGPVGGTTIPIVLRHSFRRLWNSLYGGTAYRGRPYSWERNPEVWVLEFEKYE